MFEMDVDARHLTGAEAWTYLVQHAVAMYLAVRIQLKCGLTTLLIASGSSILLPIILNLVNRSNVDRNTHVGSTDPNLKALFASTARSCPLSHRRRISFSASQPTSIAYIGQSNS